MYLLVEGCCFTKMNIIFSALNLIQYHIHIYTRAAREEAFHRIQLQKVFMSVRLILLLYSIVLVCKFI